MSAVVSIVPRMKSAKAVEQLKELRPRAADAAVQSDGQISKTWRLNVRTVLAGALGEDHHLVREADKVKYSPGFWTENTDFRPYYKAGISRLAGVVDSAIYALELQNDPADVELDEASHDQELLAHVRNTIDAGDWEKLAAQVAIFVEDRVRKWSESEAAAVGKGLYGAALADDAELRLGQVKGEWEGWRFLGMGLAQAVGNADRHRIQDRDDLKRYAIGVLGLGSLLLTQLRYEHADLIASRTL